MDFESFRVELHGGNGDPREVEEVVRRLPHIKPDADSLPLPGSTCYVIDDGRHVLELEVKNAPPRASFRFTLCHPPSVDAVFLHSVRELMAQLGMETTICDDVPPQYAHPFSLREFEECSAVISRCITDRRDEWLEAFGSETLPASTNEVFQRIILPQCQPVGEKAEPLACSNVYARLEGETLAGRLTNR